jgi:hypothetical protein
MRRIKSKIVISMVLFLVLGISQSYCQTSDNNLSQVTILSDGSVTPLTAPIQQNSNLYTLTGDIHAELVVQKSNIVIDGNGYTIKGVDRSVGKGVYLNDLINMQIKNLAISDFFLSISLYGCSFVVVEDNYLENQGNGIVLDYGCYNKFARIVNFVTFAKIVGLGPMDLQVNLPLSHLGARIILILVCGQRQGKI